jgi:hypothetical protein
LIELWRPFHGNLAVTADTQDWFDLVLSRGVDEVCGEGDVLYFGGMVTVKEALKVPNATMRWVREDQGTDERGRREDCERE